MNYRKYDPLVKKMIISTGNRKLFPEMNIPRTTINYWLRKSKEKLTSESDPVYERAIEILKKENFEEKAKSLLMQKCLRNILKNSEFYDSNSRKNREFIVGVVEEFKYILSIKLILEIIGISSSTFYRWRTESLGCRYNNLKKCLVSRPNQLSFDEQRKLVKFATARQFKTFSTVSLMYYCKRKNLLNCSLESWYKYLRLYGINRKNKNNKKTKYRNGLRAKRIDEYWHIDITEIKYGNSKKAYLQLVVDNYSRLIVGWKLGDRKTMDLTYKTMIKSFNFAPNFNGDIICDGGGENIGHKPQKLLLGRGVRQLIAKKDIKYSNSMVEAVFRQFKQRFLLKPMKNYDSVGRLIYKFVGQYNNKIPHSKLFGATPLERYKGAFCRDTFKSEVKENLIGIKRLRKLEYFECQKCQRKYSRSSSIKHKHIISTA